MRRILVATAISMMFLSWSALSSGLELDAPGMHGSACSDKSVTLTSAPSGADLELRFDFDELTTNGAQGRGNCSVAVPFRLSGKRQPRIQALTIKGSVSTGEAIFRAEAFFKDRGVVVESTEKQKAEATKSVELTSKESHVGACGATGGILRLNTSVRAKDSPKVKGKIQAISVKITSEGC